MNVVRAHRCAACTWEGLNIVRCLNLINVMKRTAQPPRTKCHTRLLSPSPKKWLIYAISCLFGLFARVCCSVLFLIFRRIQRNLIITHFFSSSDECPLKSWTNISLAFCHINFSFFPALFSCKIKIGAFFPVCSANNTDKSCESHLYYMANSAERWKESRTKSCEVFVTSNYSHSCSKWCIWFGAGHWPMSKGH